jgi:hypothetical protein
MTLLSEEALEQLECSKAYLVADFVLNWIGAVGELILITYGVHWWRRYSEDGPGFDPQFLFWLKMLLMSVGLLSIRWMKDAMFAWLGASPPNYGDRFGPKQIQVGSPEMRLILEAQSRANRIRERGHRVDQLLAHSEKRCSEQLKKVEAGRTT